MKEIIYKVTPEKESLLSGMLLASGFSAFYFEKSEGVTLLKIYTDGDIPFCIKDETPFFSTDIDPDSWSHAWSDSYRGSELTRSIYVLPQGIEPPEKSYSSIIAIDPYDSFGDGHHPTTRLCGELLELVLSGGFLKKTPGDISMLDVGTGSGILSVAAWYMGVRDIDLFDYDHVSVEKARKNLHMNGIDSLKPFTADIYSFETQKKYDLITANLLSKLLEDNSTRLKELLKPGGMMIFSGISVIWTEQMMKLFKSLNLEIIEHRVIDDWNGFLLAPSKL